jgi:hypothetical protein
VADTHEVYVVDPSPGTQFEAALNLGDDAHIQMTWCTFAEHLASRLLGAFHADLVASASDLCLEHGWTTEPASVPDLVDRLHAQGLVAVGRIRARWLLDDQAYLPETDTRGLVADLLLGVGLAERGSLTKARFREDGVVELIKDGNVATTVLPASGRGTRRWPALEARALEAVGRLHSAARPEHVLVCGAPGPQGAEIAPPQDLIRGDAMDDIIEGFGRPRFVSAEALRADPDVAAELVA